MSYYRPSQTVAMSRGSGRGYSSPRGSSTYRGGSRGGGSSWNDRGSGRGSGFSSSRGGRFASSWGTSNSNSFDSRSRYSSSGGGGDRYSSSSRGRNDDPNYRRSSYRSEGPNSSYSSSRDGNNRSPDRKRMRTEAPSSRRSHGHDGGYGGDSYSGSGNSGRYESSGGQGHGSYSDRRSFSDERRTAFRPRDEYRKPAPPPPPSNARSPRGSYRGSGRMNTRGVRGSRLSMRDTLVRRRLLDSSSASYLRRRGATIRSTSDYLRRLRMSRLRSAAARRTIKKSKSSEKEESDKEEEIWDDEVTEAEKKKEEDTEKGTEDKDKRSTPTKKSPKKDKDKEKDESDKEDKKSASDDEERPRSKYTGRPFIRLTCIHCGMKCVTFREYSVHLFSGRHITAMRKIAIRQKAVLARMRQQQRSAQRELEKSDDTLGPRTIFCPLCKLNYRQLKSKHQMSDAHRNMKKFLMPYCRVCHITFKSPMLYENHMCSLEHIKRKAQTEVVNGDKHSSEKDPESPAEEDLENFMTLDSVGDVDDEEEEGGKAEKSPSGETEAPSKPKETINVGAEHVKKVEVYYCDLCHIYLSRHEEEDRVLKQHCRGRLHLQLYVRYKEDKDLRRQAERIHRKSQEAKKAKEKEEKEKEKVPVKVKAEKTEDVKEGEEEEKREAEPGNEDDKDDKMWADVDKDLGEILATVNTETGNKSEDDEDDDSRPDGERYDRFRLSEKGGEEKGDLKTEGEEKDAEKKEEIVNEEKHDEEEKTDDK